MAGTAAARVLVAGIGNVFATDDGFGPEVARRLSERARPDGVRVVDYGIRGMHLAYDLLDPWDAVVLVDALPDRGAVGAVAVLEIGPEHLGAGAQVDAHAMDPATVLATLSALGGQLPGRTLLVGCQVADTGEGMGLSPPVEAAVGVALDVVDALLTCELHPSGVV
ncbi:MAG: hydrogenase maturation protease [Modestobacter sp.]|nr:hydrogenase maturation protease [Modestobacter sp.]